MTTETNKTDLSKLVDQVNEKYEQVSDNTVQVYHKEKKDYDCKPQALPLKVNDFSFFLNPKITKKSDKISFNSFKWEVFFFQGR